MPKPKKTSSLLDTVASKDIHLEHGQIELVDETKSQKTSHRFRRNLALGILPILFLLLLGWIVASFYLPKVRIANNVVSARQPDAVLQSLVHNAASSYKLAIVYPDNSQKQYSLADIGLYVEDAPTISNLRDKQHGFVSHFHWWHPIQVYPKISTDDSLLNSFVSQKATVTIQPAKDATISIKDGQVQLSDAVAGKHYGLVEPIVSLTSSVASLKSESLRLQTLSTRPAVSSKQLASSQTKLQKILKQNVVFIIDGKKFQAASADIADWIEITPKDSGRDVDITVNSGKVLAYINKISSPLTHPPKAQVQTISTSGISSVLVNGVNGTDILDKSEVADEVAQNLLAGKAIQEALDVKFSAYKTITAQSYPKWIEVDTTNKRMYAYEQDSLVRTFLISAGAPRTPTVTGQFAIYSKYVQQDMRGHNVDGSSYFQPKVPWVNYFYADYAIHGNYWRPLSYFGYINSSHGCVGVVESDAQWVYTWAPIGTPVVVHS